MLERETLILDEKGAYTSCPEMSGVSLHNQAKQDIFLAKIKKLSDPVY